MMLSTAAQTQPPIPADGEVDGMKGRTQSEVDITISTTTKLQPKVINDDMEVAEELNAVDDKIAKDQQQQHFHPEVNGPIYGHDDDFTPQSYDHDSDNQHTGTKLRQQKFSRLAVKALSVSLPQHFISHQHELNQNRSDNHDGATPPSIEHTPFTSNSSSRSSLLTPPTHARVAALRIPRPSAPVPMVMATTSDSEDETSPRPHGKIHHDAQRRRVIGAEDMESSKDIATVGVTAAVNSGKQVTSPQTTRPQQFTSLTKLQLSGPLSPSVPTRQDSTGTSHVITDVNGYQILPQTISKCGGVITKEAVHVISGEHVIIQIINKNEHNSSEVIKRAKHEADILRKLSHKNITRVLEIVESNKYVFIIKEKMDNGDLFDCIARRQRLTESEARGLLSALHKCHRANIVHADVTLENIFLTWDKTDVKLGEFGSAFNPEDYMAAAYGSTGDMSGQNLSQHPLPRSLAYSSPERITSSKYGSPFKGDVWSAGVVLYTMLCGCLPFTASTQEVLASNIVSGRYRPLPSDVSPGAEDILRMMLTTDTNTRATVLEASAHPWLNLGYEQRLYDVLMSTQQQSENNVRVPLNTAILHKLRLGHIHIDSLDADLARGVQSPLTASYHLLNQQQEREAKIAIMRSTFVPIEAHGVLSPLQSTMQRMSQSLLDEEFGDGVGQESVYSPGIERNAVTSESRDGQLEKTGLFNAGFTMQFSAFDRSFMPVSPSPDHRHTSQPWSPDQQSTASSQQQTQPGQQPQQLQHYSYIPRIFRCVPLTPTQARLLVNQFSEQQRTSQPRIAVNDVIPQSMPASPITHRLHEHNFASHPSSPTGKEAASLPLSPATAKNKLRAVQFADAVSREQTYFATQQLQHASISGFEPAQRASLDSGVNGDRDDLEDDVRGSPSGAVTPLGDVSADTRPSPISGLLASAMRDHTANASTGDSAVKPPRQHSSEPFSPFSPMSGYSADFEDHSSRDLLSRRTILQHTNAPVSTTVSGSGVRTFTPSDHHNNSQQRVTDNSPHVEAFPSPRPSSTTPISTQAARSLVYRYRRSDAVSTSSDTTSTQHNHHNMQYTQHPQYTQQHGVYGGGGGSEYSNTSNNNNNNNNATTQRKRPSNVFSRQKRGTENGDLV